MTRAWLLGLGLAVGLATGAQALYREWGPWKPGENLSASFWPKGATTLVNRKERVGGHMLNRFDHFKFRGDLPALNVFLADLGQVEGARTVYLLDAEQNAGFISPVVEGAAWTMSLSSNSHVGVFITTIEKLPLEGLKIPAEVGVAAFGKVSDAVKRFADEHEKRRAASQKGNEK
jgi:hypothetical protein